MIIRISLHVYGKLGICAVDIYISGKIANVNSQKIVQHPRFLFVIRITPQKLQCFHGHAPLQNLKTLVLNSDWLEMNAQDSSLIQVNFSFVPDFTYFDIYRIFLTTYIQ